MNHLNLMFLKNLKNLMNHLNPMFLKNLSFH
jgi:hypothetical protein